MRELLERLEEKHAANPPSWCGNCRCSYIGKNRVVKITCSNSEMVL
jgi:hypothetical protein